MVTSINKKHTLLTTLFIMILSLGCILLSVRIADADTLIDSGTCGEALTWELTDTGTDTVLTISGTGEMYDYNTDSETSPWYAQRESITSVIVGENVTGIGAHAFDGCVLLSKAELPDSVNAINENSFGSCDSLYIYCSEDSYAEQYAVDNGIPYDLTTGHQPDSTTISVEKEATCTEDGKRTYVCSTCKREVEEAIPASHKWSDDYTVDKPATYDEDGLESIHCSECGVVKEGSSKVIPKLAKESISKATVSGIASKTYTGAAIEQEPIVIINEKTLINGTDYSLSYKNNKNAGKATVIITGIGSYTGTVSKTFTISKKKPESKLVPNIICACAVAIPLPVVGFISHGSGVETSEKVTVNEDTPAVFSFVPETTSAESEVTTATTVSSDVSAESSKTETSSSADKTEPTTATSTDTVTTAAEESETDEESTEETSEEQETPAETPTEKVTEAEVTYKYKNGEYKGSAEGYSGKVYVKLTIENDVITSISAWADDDDPEYFGDAMNKVIPQIAANLSADVDACSGATYSSKGIMEAAGKALEQALN